MNKASSVFSTQLSTTCNNIFINSVIIFILFIFYGCSSSRFSEFVTADKDKLMEGDKELRFVSYNIPNLHYIEDYLDFRSSNPWRLPDEYEIRDALNSINQLGGS